MSNMSYCRFQNTVPDLKDCLDNLEEPCSAEEHRARRRLVELCATVVTEWIGGSADEDPKDWAETLPTR